MDFRGLMAVAAAVVLLMVSSSSNSPVLLVSGQAVATSCTAAMITSFTPCLGYITGGNTSSSPTVACCKSMEAVVSTSASCACLFLAGGVPLIGVPFNRTLAVTLPKACNSAAVPLQCKDTSPQLPAPGPAAVSPAAPPLPAAAEAPAPLAVVATPPATSQPQTKPQVVASSAWRRALPALVLLLAAGGAAVV